MNTHWVYFGLFRKKVGVVVNSVRVNNRSPRPPLPLSSMAIENPNPRKSPKTIAIETIGWEFLPHDLLLKIFSKLEIEEILVGAPLVCRAWYAASLDPSLYKVLDLQDWRRIFDRISKGGRRRPLPADLLKTVVTCGGEAIERIRFMKTFVREPDFIFIAHRCPNLKFFYLRSPVLISKEVFCYAISKWKDLEGMDVDEHSLKREILEAIHTCCKNFVDLRVAGRLSISHATNIVHYLPKLKFLDLSKTILTQDALLVILKGCKELEFLDIRGCGLHGIDPEVVGKLADDMDSFGFEKVPFLWELERTVRPEPR